MPLPNNDEETEQQMRLGMHIFNQFMSQIVAPGVQVKDIVEPLIGMDIHNLSAVQFFVGEFCESWDRKIGYSDIKFRENLFTALGAWLAARALTSSPNKVN